MFAVSGSGSSYLDIRLKASLALEFPRMTSAGGGRFAGVYLEPIDVPLGARETSRRNAGAVAFRDVREPGSARQIFSLTSATTQTFPAGRYRVYLLADGPTTVRVPVSSGTGMALHPLRAFPVSYAGKPDIVTSPVDASNVQPLRINGSRSISLSAMIVGGFRTFAGDIGTCLRKEDNECGSATARGADGPYTSVGVSPLEDYGLAWRVSYLPGAIAPGEYEAFQGALNLGGVKWASGAAFSFPLAP